MDVAKIDEFDINDSDCEDKIVGRSPSKNSNRTTSYLTPKARLAFNQLKRTFTKAPILRYFDPKCHIRIEIDMSGYVIGSMLSQFTDSGQWHLVAYYLQKMILAKTRYKTHDSKFLPIIEAFKI